jgi:hypothetical protein
MKMHLPGDRAVVSDLPCQQSIACRFFPPRHKCEEMARFPSLGRVSQNAVPQKNQPSLRPPKTNLAAIRIGLTANSRDSLKV